MGLDPNENRIQKELAAPKPAPLEPPFPYSNLSFDPGFFGVDQDPILPDGQTAYTGDR